MVAPAAFILTLGTAGAQNVTSNDNPSIDNRSLSNRSYYSHDEYRLAHSLFDTITSDLNKAQTAENSTNHSTNLGDSPRFDIAHEELGALEQNWDRGRYDSRQIENTILALEMVTNDNRLSPHDRDALARDVSRLLDFRSDYY